MSSFLAQQEALAHEQQAFLGALVGARDDRRLWPLLHAGGARTSLTSRGLQAYQANGAALGERVLASAYPVISQLVGEESFAPLARHFWRQQPPGRGDLACWGGGLAAFIEASTQLADEPFLPDVARIEWALHTAATAFDVAAEPASLALLSDGSENITLTLAAGVFLLASAYPAASIVGAHLYGEPSLAQISGQLRAGLGEQVLVWRQGYKPRLKAVRAAEYALLVGLQAGVPLESALDAALEASSDFNFADWLARSVQAGLVVGAGFHK